MPSLISSLTKIQRQKLLEDLNYLNTGEIKGLLQAAFHSLFNMD